MKDITLNNPEVHSRKLSKKIISSWLPRLRFLKKKGPRDAKTCPKELTYDVEEIRRSEYPLLDGEVYLDHTGTTLFPRSAMDNFVKDTTTNLYGNPHSESASSRLSTLKIEKVRLRALQFFNASLDDFDLVFVQNATAAIKLVAEIMQSHSEAEGGFWYGYHSDSHTSLVGIREIAKSGYVCFDCDEDVEKWMDLGATRGEEGATERVPPTRLFAYPGQSNMTGRRLSLSWPGRIRRSAINSHGKTYTLLDAAALASTADLDFGNPADAPDFIALSFYKIFGFPDLGALLVRRELSSVLRRRKYFGGGTVEMVLNGLQWHSLAEHPHEYLEDGTLPFHNIIALGHALTAHERLYTSQKLVSQHTAWLSKNLYESMASLRHTDGTPLCVIYKDTATTYGDPTSAGSTIAFNVRYADGTWVKLDDLETLAKNSNVHLRTGGVCNPGGIARSLGLAPWEFLRNYAAGMRCGHGPVVLGGKPAGIARVSLGAMSNAGDVYAFTEFLRRNFEDVLPEPGRPFQWRAGMGLVAAGVMIYPLEGAGVWRVPSGGSWSMEESRLRWDRAWTLVNLDTGEVLTRETAPRLLLLTPEIDVERGVLCVTPHKSLGTTRAGGTHLCLPLEEDVAGVIQEAACGDCAGGDFQMLARSVKRGNAFVEARVCVSERVVAFFSTSLDTKCTVARILGSTHRGIFGARPCQEPSDTIVVENSPPPPSRLVEDSDTSGTIVSAAYTNISRGLDSPRPLEEALAESMQANVILAHYPQRGNPSREQDWIFLTIGGRCTDESINGGRGPHRVAFIADERGMPERLPPHQAQGGAKLYRLLRSGEEGEASWKLETGQRFVLQAPEASPMGTCDRETGQSQNGSIRLASAR